MKNDEQPAYMTIGRIVGEFLRESFIRKLRKEKLLAAPVGRFSEETRRAISDSIEHTRRLDDFLLPGAKL